MSWDDGRSGDAEASKDGGISAGTIAHALPSIVLAVLVLAFALANTTRTKVNFIVTETRAPLILVLLATAVVGALIGALLKRRRKD